MARTPAVRVLQVLTHWIRDVMKMEEFWELLFALIQMLYPLYRLLHLCDTKTGCVDKVKYFVMQTDRLLESGLNNVLEKLDAMDNKFDVVVSTTKKATKKKKKGDKKIDLGGEYFVALFMLPLCTDSFLSVSL
jgi:hypothetical protein